MQSLTATSGVKNKYSSPGYDYTGNRPELRKSPKHTSPEIKKIEFAEWIVLREILIFPVVPIFVRVWFLIGGRRRRDRDALQINRSYITERWLEC